MSPPPMSPPPSSTSLSESQRTTREIMDAITMRMRRSIEASEQDPERLEALRWWWRRLDEAKGSE
jgi:hypothetical protein